MSACRRYLKHVTISGENAGLHLILHYQGDKTEKELLDQAAEKESGCTACLIPISGRLPENWQPALILGYAGLHEEKLEAGNWLLSDCI